MGGYWINEGLPQYVAIYRNTENGCGIQKYADGSAGIMIQLNFVKKEEEKKIQKRMILEYHMAEMCS